MPSHSRPNSTRSEIVIRRGARSGSRTSTTCCSASMPPERSTGPLSPEVARCANKHPHGGQAAYYALRPMVDNDRVAAALPSYEVGSELGRGACGVVLAGQHRQLGRLVAIKQLPRAFGADPAVRARFLAEARVLATLDHP